MTPCNPRRDPPHATAFATFVCAWALLLAVLALSTAPRAGAPAAAPIVAAAPR